MRSTRELLEVALDTWYLAHTLSSRLQGDIEMGILRLSTLGPHMRNAIRI